MSSLWLRFPDEITDCPACTAPRMMVLDVLPIRRDLNGHRVAFLTGCHSCGLLAVSPMPTEEQLERYYADEGPYRAHKVEAGEVRRLERKKAPRRTGKKLTARERLLDALIPYLPAPGRVLDFGCGDGKFLDRLQDRGWETYGIEPSTGVAFARHHRLAAPPQDGSFDFVILHHVIEHVSDPLGVLRQLAGALREGGILFLSVPRLDTVAQHGLLRYCIDGRKHLVSFSEACLTGLLARAGFAATARLDARPLDEALTGGQPLRLRLVATRTRNPPPPPSAPLGPALKALRDYDWASEGLAGRARKLLPVRLRAAWMDRAREQSRQRS